MPNPAGKLIVLGCAVGLAAAIAVNCGKIPDVQTEPEVKIVIPPAPKIIKKSYHHAMSEEMKKSFEQADEIIIGVYTGSYVDEPQGRAFYFDNFRNLNKETLIWGPVLDVLLPIQFHDLNPDIILRNEFKRLSDLDKVGICWDFYDQKRFVYLVEGVETLVFLEQIVDETNNSSYRNLIDTYPVTEDCNAKVVFELMLREMYK